MPTVTPLRLCEQIALFRQVSGTDGTYVSLERESDPTLGRIVVAVGNVTTRRMLERVALRLAHSKVNVHRAYLDLIDDGDEVVIVRVTELAARVAGPRTPVPHQPTMSQTRDADGRPSALTTPNGLTYVNGAGEVVGRATFSAFGQVVEAPAGFPVFFAGRLVDREARLVRL